MQSLSGTARLIWPLILSFGAFVGSWATACVFPFAGFAAVSALTTDLRRGLAAVLGVWMMNQAVGYSLLGYPTDANTIAWGFAIAAGAFAGFFAARAAARLPGAIGADLDPVGVALVPVSERVVPGRTGWLDRVRIAVRERPAVLGPVVEPARAARSVARAQAAWPLHVSGLLGTDPGGLVRADEHLLALLLAAEPDLAADLSERAVAPLQALPAGAAARGEQTLRAWLDAHGDVSAAAAALHVHPQTVRYRLAGLREVFGDALDDPGARLELAIALRMSRHAPLHEPDGDA